MDEIGRDKKREDRSGGHLQILRSKQNFAALHAVGNDSANEREKEDGDAAQKLIQGQQERGVAEPVDKPALRHDLHPGADAGGAGAKPHQAKIAILKCFEDAANSVNWHSPSKSVTCGDSRANGLRSQLRVAWLPDCVHLTVTAN